jgi:hypothetical protein
MSLQLIARSPDLQRLRNEEYHIAIQGGYLLVRDVPYVNANREIKYGTLVMQLDLNGDVTNTPQQHTAMWCGEHPCHSDGRKITSFENSSPAQDLGGGLRVDFTFSAKAAYRDYHHKATTYIGRITGEAQKIDPAVNAQPSPVYEDDREESVFKYVDTASSRAGIGAYNDKVAGQNIGIIGLGGTGAYVLDQIAKTHANEIHLYDGDKFRQHNALRAPGATPVGALAVKATKVDHWAGVYSAMRRRIHPHNTFVHASNVEMLKGLNFIFLCIDANDGKLDLVRAIESLDIPFIDTGIGVLPSESGLTGLIRVSTSAKETREEARRHMSLGADGGNNLYSTNIQVGELNALNAMLAVIRWKKMYGFYRDASKDHYTGYSIATNDIVTESNT